jgi:hypothetical protein
MNKYFIYLIWVTVSCVIAAVLGKNYPAHYFDEFNIMTWFNTLQILLICLISFKIYRRKKITLWLVFSIIAFYFALDELLQFHEESGWIIRFIRHQGLLVPKALNLFGFPLISMGDIIQALYAILILGFGWRNKKEILKDKKSLNLFFIGIFILTLSEIIDFIGIHTSEKYQFLNLTEFQKSFISAVEESLKTIGFGALLMGFIKRHRSDISNLAP